MGDMTNSWSSEPSALEHELLAHLTSHVNAKSSLLEQYSKVAQQTDSNAFAILSIC